MRTVKNQNSIINRLNDILDMSKIESGKMHLVKKKYSLNQVIEDLSVVMESKIKQKKLHFVKQIELIHHTFICDELRLNQILVNFLSNSVKYCDEAGYITLIVKETAMDEKKIARINELARKAKAEGLTDAEIEERAAMRQEYLNAVMANARSVLENTYIVDEKGNKRKLRGKISRSLKMAA